MKCPKCGEQLDEASAVRVPDYGEPFVVMAIPCYYCQTVTLRQPERIDLEPAFAWARKHFGFGG